MNRVGGGLIAMALVIALVSGGSVHRIEGTTEATSPRPAVAGATKTPKSTESKSSLQSSKDPASQGLTLQGGELSNVISEATIQVPLQERPEDRDQLQKVLAGIPSHANIGFMVAIAPDPGKTHLALAFDRYMDAIQMAIQAGGFDYDRSILPWDTETHEESSSAITRQSERHFREEEEKIPGVLIFRRHQESKQPAAAEAKPSGKAHEIDTLLVFVVGETPTSGIERTQFLIAMQLGQKLSTVQGRTEQSSSPAKMSKPNLIVLGPNFSGSLYSLQQLLIPQAQQFSMITIASGEITGEKSVGNFEAGLRAAQLQSKINFASFNESTSVLEDALFHYACSDWNMKPREFAILTETETAFGEELGGEVCPASPEDDGGPLRLSFPRGIFHLRTAYEQQFPDGFPQDSQRPHVRSNLKPNLEEQRITSDSVPDFSSQSPVSQDGVLMDLVDDLQKHRSQLVLVLASDPLDSLFLVRYIRQHYAYGRVATLGPDALLRHESDDPEIRGVLSISAYSLVHTSGNHLGSSHSAAEVSFPDDSSKGAYNAARVLTACLKQSLEWCTRPLGETPTKDIDKFPIPADIDLLGYHDHSFVVHDQGAKAKYRRPAIYLDALGRDGYWPIAELSDIGHSWLPVQQRTSVGAMCVVGSAGGSSPTFTLPLSWNVLAVLGLAGLGLLAFCFYKPTILSTYEPGVLLAPAPVTCPEDRASGIRKNLIGFFCLLACAAIAFTLWPMLSPDVDMNAGYILLGLAYLFVYVLMSAFIYRQFRWRIWIFHLATTFVLGVGFLSRDSSVFRIFLFHAAQVGSEVSPLLPFILVLSTLLWWTWYNISGCALTDLRSPQLPSLAQGLPEILTPVSREEHRKLRDGMLPAALDARTWIPVAALMIVVLLLTIPARPIRSLEATGYDHVLLVTIIFSFILLLESAMRALVVWMDLKSLLRSLDYQRFAPMMFRIGGFSWSFIWKIGSGSLVKAHCLILREMETLRKASKLCGAEADELYPDTAVTKVWAIYIRLLKQKGKGIDPNIAASITATNATAVGAPGADLDFSETGMLLAFGELQQRLAKAGAQLLESLQVFYVEPEITCEVQGEEAKSLRGHPPESAKGVCEFFVCMLYINYIISVLLRIRTLAMAAVGMYVLDVIALNVYPFEPRVILHSLMIGVFAGLTVCFGIIYAQMHYDSVLSRITGTNADELGGDFWWRMLSVTGIPLASLLASEFPSIGDFLFSWIEPVTKALR
jgi:hypothetical protein